MAFTFTLQRENKQIQSRVKEIDHNIILFVS